MPVSADALQVERLEDRVQRLPCCARRRRWAAAPASGRRRGGRCRRGGGSDRAGSGARPSSGRRPRSCRCRRRSCAGRVVGHERLVLVVPHDLERDLRIVRVDLRERQAGDVVLDRAAVGRELDLAGVLLGRLLVRRVPLDLLVGDDRHRHAVLDAPLDARRDEVLDLVDVGLVDHRARCEIRARRSRRATTRPARRAATYAAIEPS